MTSGLDAKFRLSELYHDLEQERLARAAGFHCAHYPIAGGLMGVLVLAK